MADEIAGAHSHMSRRRISLAQTALVVVPVALFAFAAWEHRYSLEDGFIYYRIADNLAYGEGPVFNPGERVEVHTSAAWTMVLGLGRMLVGGIVGPGTMAAVIGVALSTAGLALAIWGSAQLQQGGQLQRAGAGSDGADGDGDRTGGSTQVRRWLIPFGAVIVVGSPMLWYFATSGLESSLCFAWAAGSFVILARRTRPSVGSFRVDRPRWQLVVIGLGWLMRPELVVYSIGFGAVWLMSGQGGRRAKARAVGWMVLVPVVYQVFRMGYYGAVVPNTALAKSAGRTDWAGGWDYLEDFVGYDRLWIPAGLAVAALVALVVVGRHRGRVWLATMLVAPVVAVLHAGYVAKIGGDFQHARMLVVPWFTFLLPIALVPLPRLRRAAAGSSNLTPARVGAAGVVLVGCLTVVVWAAATGTKWGLLQTVPTYTQLRFGQLSGENTDNPLELDDFHTPDSPFVQHPAAAGIAGQAGQDLMVDLSGPGYVQGLANYRQLQPGTGSVLVTCCIGLNGLRAGPYAYVEDTQGLAHPIASRFDVPPDNEVVPAVFGTPVPQAWVFARHPLAEPTGDPAVQAAAQALECDGLRELVDAVSEPMSPGRFFENLVRAPSLSALSVPYDPIAARDQLCR